LREYPKVPAIGVGTIIVNGARALLVRRANEPDRGRWAIPGGVLELGETIRQAASREVHEECGLDVQVGEIVGVQDLIIPDDSGRIRFHYVLIDLVATYQGGEPVPSSDSLEVAWATEEEINDFDMPKRLQELVRRVLHSADARKGFLT